VTGSIPPWFDIDKLKPLEVTQVAWFDECHKKCIIGGVANDRSNVVLRFPRDENGKLCVGSGSYSNEDVIRMKVKYAKEGRFCFSCAIVEREGEQVGVRGDTFDYSGKTLLSISEYNKRINVEITRVKGLTRGGAWINDPRQEGSLYRNDPPTRLKGCGPATAKKLIDFGINTIGDLRLIGELKKQEIKAGGKLLKLDNFISQASQCRMDEDAPPELDHRKAPNPYLSIHGEEEWLDVIARTTMMAGYTCVTHLIEYNVASCKKMFAGTTHEAD
jgi:hypothetical protein